jgi:hypothetical protein
MTKTRRRSGARRVGRRAVQVCSVSLAVERRRPAEPCLRHDEAERSHAEGSVGIEVDVVSSTCIGCLASAGRQRVLSRLSRSLILQNGGIYSLSDPWSSNSLYRRRARSSGLAVTNSFTAAGHGGRRPCRCRARRAPPPRPGGWGEPVLEVQQGLARTPGIRLTFELAMRPTASVRRSGASSASASRCPPGAAQRLLRGSVPVGSPARRRPGRARRCRDGQSRNAAPGACASVPLPAAAGPSTAMIICPFFEILPPSPRTRSMKPGKLVAMAPSST